MLTGKELESLRAAKRAAHAEARAVIRARREQEATLATITEHRAGRERPVHPVRAAALARTRDADLPQVGTFHG
ncbi:hypothetical protein ABZT49_12275 [Methylobacterium sp. EM32]|uniref:hypothetical protein n=1 Tax=Methylobacterium sp. EM32 TaxID=3163481 RepID=UPI0033B0E9B1